jgi:hypothetical protein
MREDRLLGPIVARSPPERAAALARTPLAPLAAGFAAHADVGGAWVAHWRTLWPADRSQRAPLERLLRAAGAARARIAASPAQANSRDALQELARQLVASFRRHPLSPNATVACLALLALDVLRLRGALAVRALRDTAAGTP